MKYRNLTAAEIDVMKANMCSAGDWSKILVAEDFTPENIFYTRFSGDIRLGTFNKEFELAGGMKKHSGLYYVTLHNVKVGNDCCIENVKNYIANYDIGDSTFIENIDIILTDGPSSFGNGVDVAVMSETGGREVKIFDKLSAQQAYIMALYRHRPKLICKMKAMVLDYVNEVTSHRGTIGSHVTIVDSGYIKNVKIGDYTKIEGSARLKNGSINSTKDAPVKIGVGVVADDFIISSGSSVVDGVSLSKCFVGQSCKLRHNYSAFNSLFFSNCQGYNGEACSIFAGPFTVTHHKSTLLIAGMFSFMNAGSGSNQSNHMYKLGPIHQGIMERGAKTASDSYILWPAKVGAFSLVMGRHMHNQDTSDLPFSYLIEQDNVSYIVPGANLKSVGTIRDAQKWPKRDERVPSQNLDCVNYNLLSPYTIRKVLNGLAILHRLEEISGHSSEEYTYQSGKIKRSSLLNGMKYYTVVIHKFLGNSLISRLTSGSSDSSGGVGPCGSFSSVAEMQAALVPNISEGSGKWVDIAGMIAPWGVIDILLSDVESGRIASVDALQSAFASIHANYYTYEWTWAYEVIKEFYGVDLSSASVDVLVDLIEKWKKSVVWLDEMLLEDARKEFTLSAMTSFGADGGKEERELDFVEVRGALFESDPFVIMLHDHIAKKSALGDSTIAMLRALK